MNATKLCEGRWSEISSWEFFLSDQLPPLELCTAASCVGILEPSGDIVLSRTHRGWSCMGGHIEEGETPEQAMKREALEEGGFRVERFRLLGFRRVTSTQQIVPEQTGKPYPFPVSYIVWYVALGKLPLAPTAGDEGEVFESRAFSTVEVDKLQLEHQAMVDAAVTSYRSTPF